MKQFILIALLALVAACNEPENVAVITADFPRHLVGEYAERGLTISAFNFEEVLEEYDNQGFPTTPQALAIKYADAINSMPTGSVVLAYDGGYESALDALSEYPNREIYCSTYYGPVPSGCIPIQSPWHQLEALAPVSLADWQAQQQQAPQTDNRPVAFTVQPQPITAAQFNQAVNLFSEFGYNLSGVHSEQFEEFRITYIGGTHGNYNGAGLPFYGIWAYYDLMQSGRQPNCSVRVWVNDHVQYDNGCDGVED